MLKCTGYNIFFELDQSEILLDENTRKSNAENALTNTLCK